MKRSHNSFLTLFLVLCTSAQWASSTVVMPVKRDRAGTGFTAEIKQGSKLKAQQFAVDIEQDFTTAQCAASSTFKPVSCADDICKSYASATCKNDTCGVPGSSSATLNLGVDKASFVQDDGQTVTATLPFACSASAVAGLSPSALGLPRRLSSALNIKPQFSLCLPRGRSTGAAFIGGGPMTGRDIRTSLVSNPKHADTFYVPLKGIKVDGANVALDTTKFDILSNGDGGSKLSTAVRYTQMASGLHKVLVDAFVKAAIKRKMKKVAAVSPFSACFDAKTVTRVPLIDLVFPGNGADVAWSVKRGNSMVKAKNGAVCLAFVDAGENPTAAVVVGSYQMEDTLVVFDLSTTLLEIGFNLRQQNVSCSTMGLKFSEQ